MGLFGFFLSLLRSGCSKYSISSSLSCPSFFIYLLGRAISPCWPSLYLLLFQCSDSLRTCGPKSLFVSWRGNSYVRHVATFSYHTAVFGEKFLSSSSKETQVLFELDIMIFIIKVNGNHDWIIYLIIYVLTIKYFGPIDHGILADLGLETFDSLNTHMKAFYTILMVKIDAYVSVIETVVNGEKQRGVRWF